ncbi:hypothetical protein AB0L75_24595 [Streptomyces sp. NPDC052101]|uniref:hypothetical protein n=1 Tax=Streptomyces sp. NPDC052101 TaxID=3155763 RepID=UPI00343C8E11
MRATRLLRRGLALSGLLAACLVVPASSGAAGTAHACITRSAKETGTVREDAVSRTPDEAVQRDLQQHPSVHPAKKRPHPSFTVPVYWTVLYDKDNPSDGSIPDEAINKQIELANTYFRNIGLRFQLMRRNRVATDHTTLHGLEYFNDGPLKRQYHMGNEQTVNIYSANSDQMPGGWFTYPWDYQDHPDQDGVVLPYDSLPGGTDPHHNQGKTAIHQIRHWVGLFNTFQGRL